MLSKKIQIGHKQLALWGILAVMAASACAETEFKGSSRQELPTIERSFQQLSYPETVSTYTQGHTGDVQDENFEQGEWGKLDLLVVVDNSGSMQDEQENLSTKLAPLLSHIEKSDWQIAVVTTDPSQGCQKSLIKKTDPQANAKFTAAVQAGTGGSGYEEGISQAVEGLKCGNGFFGGGDSWVRDDSTIAVLIVSDEDNCHGEDDDYSCSDSATRYGEYLTDYLESIRDVGKDARVYGLFWHPTTLQTDCAVAAKEGIEYAKVVDATGGKWGSICDADYTETLTQISEDVARILKYEFELSHVPDAGTLKITVDGEEWDKYTLTDRLVAFSEPPPFGSKVDVAYRHGAEGDLLTDFDLEKPAATDDFKVSVDGEDIPADTFTFDATENQLEFSSAPKERSEIQITYREKITLLTEFEIGPKAQANSIAVKIDDIKVSSGWSYDQERGMLVFKEAPAPDANILVTFKELK